jgi:hypothetical protein
MKRTKLTASLVGSAAAGLLAVAAASPAWAQATTYPEGTDCSAIQNSANRTDCMSQQNESRQNMEPGTGSAPGSDTNQATPPNPNPGTAGNGSSASPNNTAPGAGADQGNGTNNNSGEPNSN